MARRANFIADYERANPNQRVRIIFLNYQAFPDIIKGFEKKVVIRIMDEINRARREEIGDLGVRIQCGGRPNSPTEKEGDLEIEIEEAIHRNYLSENLLVDIETAEDHIRTVNVLYMMRRDYDSVEAAIKTQGGENVSILKDALAGISMTQIGDRVNMSEHYVRNLVSEMNTDIKEQVAMDYKKYYKEA